MRTAFLSAVLLPALLQFGWLTRGDQFSPSIRLSGIGIDREHLSDAVVEKRAESMISTQTFSILRDPQALSGAQRILSPKLQKIFASASRQSGWPASLISAVAYLESWGLPDVQSSAGPKGIMQIAGSTAKSMGLRMIYATRYRVSSEKVTVKGRRGKVTTRVVKKRTPYQVLVRDERLLPERAVPAAANYLAKLANRYGARDWAIFAYHCGEGCAAEVQGIVRRSRGFKDDNMSVARTFFSASPAYNKDLYDVLQHHMERDFSPTYWFRIMRAEQLLKLYSEDPAEFKRLFNEYRNRLNPEQRAPHRLAVWLRPDDLEFRTCEDLKREQGKKLVQAFDNAKRFGFTIRPEIGAADPANQDYYRQASPSTMGVVAYVAYETRRLHEAMKPKGEKFVPLEITSLVEPLDYESRTVKKVAGKPEAPSHCSGQVFDVNYGSLPPGEREALEFILTDLGWDGHVGFVRDSVSESSFHVGASPSSRDFFNRVYMEATEKKTE